MRSLFSLSILVLAGIAVFTAAPAGPLPPPAVLIDSGLNFVRSDQSQAYASAAFDGTNWLVVWQDKRGDREAVWGTRVNSAGAPLDSANICIADDEDHREEPRVAFNGTCYLVAWQDSRNPTYDIYGARVTPAGTVLDPDGFPISRSAGSQKSPAVASAGSEFLVVWQDTRTSGNDEDIYAARVTGSGQVLDTGGIAISTALAPQEYPAVTGRAGGYLVAWKDRRNDSLTSDDVYAARVTAAGSVLDPAGIAVTRAPESQDYPMLASDGTNCLIVWGDYRNGNGDVYGARVSDAGAVLDPSGLPIHTSANFWQGDPDVAFTGSQYIVIWEDDSTTGGGDCDLLATRVTTSGAVLDTVGVVLDSAYGDQYWPVIALGGSHLLVAWQDYRDGDPDIYATRVSPSGGRLDTADVMLSRLLYAYEQSTPAVAFDGANFLTVWHDDRAPQTSDKLYGARITPSGSLLDPGGFLIGEYTTLAGAPAVAFGDSSYLVALNLGVSSYAVIAARVSPAGAVLDTSPIYTAISGQEGSVPAVAFDGTNWLLVSGFKDFGNQYNVKGVRIAPDGARLDSTPFRISYGPKDKCYPAVAFGTTNYLAVWQDFRSGSNYDIYGARVSPDGTVLDTGSILISPSARTQYAPSVAFDGTNWLVGWQNWVGDPYRETLYYARVSQSGTVLDPEGLSLGWAPENYQDPLQLAFDGTDYFAVWQYHSYGEGDLYGARISPAGAVIDSFPVCTAPEYQATPAIAVGTGGRVMVGYAGYVETIRGYPAQTMRIWAGIYPFYGIEDGITPHEQGAMPTATIVRGVLLLPPSLLSPPSSLLSIDGRKVLDLKPGPNDVSGLSPGVYFVITTSPFSSPPEGERVGVRGRRSSIAKVLITK